MAFNTANAAFASANNVAPQVTPAYNTANAAFNTANAAFASANNVAPQVTPAFNTANLAFLNSNVAFDTANAAFASANNVAPQVTPSYNTANAAFNTANAAYNAANNVGPQIAPAYTAANNAYNTANAAYGYANASNTFATSTFIKQVAPSQTITGDLAVTGNLTFLGNAATISSNNLIVGDSMIYLAANNYSGTDILDIGFVANYGNTTGANVHTGLLRDATTKQYYLFNGLDIELHENNTTFVPYANGVVNAVLNADLYTSNLSLGGANAINWINAAFTKANTSIGGANVGQTTPTTTQVGSFWWNSDLGKLFIYYTDPANTSQWVETSPSVSSIESSIVTGYVNPAYNTANVAFNTANASYNTANAAYANANSKLANSTTTYSGTLTIDGNLTFTTGNNNLTLPTGTTAARPSAASNGMIRYNTTLSTFEGYKAGSWGAIGGGATGGGSDDVFYENSVNVTASYTITTNKNAMTAGPVTMADGITITIPVGSTWTIV